MEGRDPSTAYAEPLRGSAYFAQDDKAETMAQDDKAETMAQDDRAETMTTQQQSRNDYDAAEANPTQRKPPARAGLPAEREKVAIRKGS